MLKFQSVSLSIQKNDVLKNLNFEILPGEMVAILGSSGAGKSSIFNLLIAQTVPTLGKILLDDLSLGTLSFNSIQKYRRQIGIVFQDFRLLKQKTVFENVAFALEVCGEERTIKARVSQLLKLVGLWDKRHAFPAQISGGEKQRTAIARALVHDPKLLIADEATGNLDPHNAREIADLLLDLNKNQGLTILLATHDPLVVKRLNPRIIRLEKGKITLDARDVPLQKAFNGLLEPEDLLTRERL